MKQKNKINALEVAFLLFLILYPMRHVNWGLDLWDTGYNYANFVNATPENVSSMWFFSTYLANMVGHLMSMLPFGHTLIGLNVYTGLTVSVLGVTGYLFFRRQFELSPGLCFLGEVLAVSMCWCPTALLYNYLTYVLLLISCILLYQGLIKDNKAQLILAGACLGLNLFVRLPNVAEVALIVAVWVYDLLVYRKNKQEEKQYLFWKNTLLHTGWCVLGYGISVAVFLIWFTIRYGFTTYVDAITQLFAMTDHAEGYKATSMIMGIVNTFRDELYWCKLMIALVVALIICFMAMQWVVSRINRETVGKVLFRISEMVAVLACVGFFVYLQTRGYYDISYYHYGAILHPGVLFILLTLCIIVVRLFSPSCPVEEKTFGVMIAIVLFVTSIGSNNNLYPSMNNLFLAAPYTLWQLNQWFAVKKHHWLYPAKSMSLAIVLLCTIQFTLFGACFQFAEATGMQDVHYKVTGSRVLANVKMSAEKAEIIQELLNFANENDLSGQNVILYGYIPALSYYLEMPAAFHPWADLESYNEKVMREDLARVHESTPVIILENAYYLDMNRVLGYEEVSFEGDRAEKYSQDSKWQMLLEYINEKGYRCTFHNDRFAVLQVQ